MYFTSILGMLKQGTSPEISVTPLEPLECAIENRDVDYASMLFIEYYI